MDYTLKIDDKVIKELRRIDRTWQKRILNKMKTTLTKDPYSGKKLVGNFSPFWCLRVGDYRTTYAIEGEIVTVEVVNARHKREAH